MATHSSILTWEIPWAEEPGRLQSMGSQSWTPLKWLSTQAGTKACSDVTGHESIPVTSFSKDPFSSSAAVARILAVASLAVGATYIYSHPGSV